jgi:hypothetical protein
VTGDHIRQQLTEAVHVPIQEASWATGVAMLDSDVVAFRERIAAALEQTVRDLIADELDAVAGKWQWGAWADMPRIADRVAERIAGAQYVTDWLRARAAALRARTEETT